MNKTIVLSTRDLTVSFETRIVIRALSFEVQAGDTFAIIGPNGAGKSVLLKALLNLLPYTGTISWAPGIKVGYVPQKIAADRQMPLRVCDLLKAKAALLKLSKNDLREVADQIALAPEIMETSIGVLSGGQFQKMLIAYALLGRPQALLFDEPTASLDELEEERVYQILEKLKKERGLTIILVSHDLSVVNRSANMVLCMSSKGTSCMGSPSQVLTQKMLETAYHGPQLYYQHGQQPPRRDP